MTTFDIEKDLQETLETITDLTATSLEPGEDMLTEVAQHLSAWVIRHRAVFSFDNFQLPTAKDNVLASYELNESNDNTPSLVVNATCGGVNSVIHDHKTWAVIIGLKGIEHHRIYRHQDSERNDRTATLDCIDELSLASGQSLIIKQGLFHSVHTEPEQPTLQLHLYGKSLEIISGRQIWDPNTRQLIYI